MKYKCLIILLMMISPFAISQSLKISDFENTDEWQVISSEGANINVSSAPGFFGRGIKIEFEFTGAGWCGIEKPVDMLLPEDYKFSFYINGTAPKNNLEFKLLDSTGENVWWLNQRNFEFPPVWQKQVQRKRNIEFAWGPAGGGEIKYLDKIQIIIAASEGGKGTVFIDELFFDTITKPDTSIPAKVSASSSTEETKPDFILDKSMATSWTTHKSTDQLLQIDFGYLKEFGGLVINWDEKARAENYSVNISNDGETYQKIFENGTGDKDFIFLRNGEARYIKLLLNSSNRNGFSIKELELKPLEFSDNPNNFFKSVSSYYPSGFFPKYFNNVQSFWTIIGVSGDHKEALLNEEGAIEVDKASFRIDPYIFYDDKIITWNDVKTEHSLLKKYLPIPSVKWVNDDFVLQVETFAAGEKGKSYILTKYRVHNKTNRTKNIGLYLAVRPYQVNPPWQFLNTVGGASKINRISYNNPFINVNDKKIISLTRHDDFGASELKNGEIITHISKNVLPSQTNIEDPLGFGSAAIKYNLQIEPGSFKDVYITIPFYDEYPAELNNITAETAPQFYKKNWEETTLYWENRLDRIDFQLPTSADKIINTLKSNLAYILINRDGPAIQPGSRSYERAWIRDGALTSSALLRLGLKEEVREYLDWYSQYQFPSGKIPCVVDHRGGDPTPENDSHGEYIFAILEYFNFSKDTAFLRDKFNTITKTVDYIEHLVNQRKTLQYQKEDSLAFYGLVPESISHEGYSAKPMHSYWDNFFTLRGLKDAVTIASLLNEQESVRKFSILRDEFQNNLYRSIDLAMKNHNINYIPGCVELGDFDATSTTISIYPGNELDNLPQPQLNNTFEKYYDYFLKRKNPDFEWDAYTPYEIRTAGTFLHLGQKEKSHELLGFFFSNQYPNEWNHWAEVVWKDKNEPRFIGDMPHTWIGSDYINVIRSMFIFEREYDSTLVLGLGLKEEWVDDSAGLSVNNLFSYYGIINYTIKSENDSYVIDLSGDITMPPGGIKIINFKSKQPVSVTIDNIPADLFTYNEITVNKFPCKVFIRY